MTNSADNALQITVVQGRSLSAFARKQIIAFCSRAYGEDMEPVFATFSEPTHVLAYHNGALVGHALWITRFLQAGSPPLLRTAYVEAVATDPTWRKRGFAAAVMRRIAAEVRDFDLAALSPFDVGYYTKLGWELWRGPLAIRTPNGLEPTPEDETVMILRLPKTPPLDLAGPLSAEWREGELW